MVYFVGAGSGEAEMIPLGGLTMRHRAEGY